MARPSFVQTCFRLPTPDRWPGEPLNYPLPLGMASDPQPLAPTLGSRQSPMPVSQLVCGIGNLPSYLRITLLSGNQRRSEHIAPRSGVPDRIGSHEFRCLEDDLPMCLECLAIGMRSI